MRTIRLNLLNLLVKDHPNQAPKRATPGHLRIYSETPYVSNCQMINLVAFLDNSLNKIIMNIRLYLLIICVLQASRRDF